MTSVQSIDRAFRLLDHLAGRPAGISELARRVDLPISTVARLLKTLQDLDVAERDDDGIFSLGRTVPALAWRATLSSQVEALDQAQLTSLSAQVEEIVGLSIRVDDDVLYIAQVDGPHEVQVRDWTGERIPMHVVSSGLVFLAYAPRADVDRFLDTDLRQFTETTEVNPDHIRARLDEIRERGYVWTKEEFYVGINSVAAPLRNADGEVVGALHSHGPSYRFPAEGDDGRIAAKIVHLASHLSHPRGWNSAGVGAVGG